VQHLLTPLGDAATANHAFRERVAQSVEHLTFNQEVAGSIPAALTKEINRLIVQFNVAPKFNPGPDNVLDNIRAISMSDKLSQPYGIKSRPLEFGAALPRRASTPACKATEEPSNGEAR
jgi:hypothetical protein